MQRNRTRQGTKAKVTVRLPQESVLFLKEYARLHGMTVTEVIERSLDRLQHRQKAPIHPDVARFSGLVPEEIDAKSEYADHLLRKHQ